MWQSHLSDEGSLAIADGLCSEALDLASGELVLLWAVSTIDVGPFRFASILGFHIPGSVGTLLVAFAVG